MPGWLITAGSFILVLGVLIFVHELGHFIAAKSVGIYVHRFSLGLGAPIPWLSFRRGETEYCVSWLPLGGYVKMAGLEEEGTAGSLEGPGGANPVPPERQFDRKSLPARLFVILAGVTMNMVFAFATFSVLAGTIGEPVDPTTTIDSVLVDRLPPGAESLARLARGDRVESVSGKTISSWDDLQTAVRMGHGRLEIAIVGKQSVTVDIPVTDAAGRAAVGDALLAYRPAVIGSVSPNSPAAAAGVMAGDTVLRINGDTVLSWSDMASKILPRAGDTLTLVATRGGSRDLHVVPEAELVAPSAGAAEGGRIGVLPEVTTVRVTHSLLGSLAFGARQTTRWTEIILITLRGLVFGEISPRELGGPILIGQMSAQAARVGWETLLTFMCILSINLAVLNLLPIPVLDGGHVVFLLIEGVRRRPLSLDARARLTQVGFLVLVGIMIFAMGNDILRLFGL